MTDTELIGGQEPVGVAPPFAAPARQHEASGSTSIVQDIIDLFAACGFEVRPEGGQFAIVGSLDAAGVLVEALVEKFDTAGKERFHWTRDGMELGENGFYVHHNKADDVGMVADSRFREGRNTKP